MRQAQYISETKALQRVASDENCRFFWTTHALERMAERNINAADVVHALTNGQVVLEEVKRDRLWRVDGRDADGQRIQVIAAVYEDAIEIKVVTAF